MATQGLRAAWRHCCYCSTFPSLPVHQTWCRTNAWVPAQDTSPPHSPCQSWLAGCQLSPALHPSCRAAGTAASAGTRAERRGRHLESWSGTKGARNSEQGELFKEEHQSVRDGERAGSDRSGLKSHLSPSSYYVNYSCSLAAAAAEVIADGFWKHLLHAKTPGPVPCSCRGAGGWDVPHCVPGQ